MIDLRAIRQRWEADGSKRDEGGRRLFAASEARAAGWGGLASVASVTGLARSTIGRGQKDLDAAPLAPGRVRREGGGPRSLTETDATLLDDLKRLVEPATLGDLVRPLLWVSKSLDKLASALVATLAGANKLGGQYLRLRCRPGPQKAICAVVASILTAIKPYAQERNRRSKESPARSLAYPLAEILLLLTCATIA